MGTLLKRIQVEDFWIEAGETVGIIQVEDKVVHILTLAGTRVIPKEWVRIN